MFVGVVAEVKRQHVRDAEPLRDGADPPRRRIEVRVDDVGAVARENHRRQRGVAAMTAATPAAR